MPPIDKPQDSWYHPCTNLGVSVGGGTRSAPTPTHPWVDTVIAVAVSVAVAFEADVHAGIEHVVEVDVCVDVDLTFTAVLDILRNLFSSRSFLARITRVAVMHQLQRLCSRVSVSVVGKV